VTAAPADGEAQETARALTFANGGGEAAITGPAVDLGRQSNGELTIAFRYRIDARPSAPVELVSGAGRVDISALFAAAPTGEWRTAAVRLSCLRDAGTNVMAVDQPWGLATRGAFAITVEAIRLQPNNGDAVCSASTGR
jgi:beta-glucosidase